MRIVLLNQFFWPDAVATSHILTDVACALAQSHEVTAICGRSKTADRNSGRDLGPKLTVIRTRTFGSGSKKLSRVISYLTFLAGAAFHALRVDKPDVYVTLTTPPLLPILGSLISLLRSVRHVIWEMDVYPDIATEVGYFKKDGWIDRLSGLAINWSRRRADVMIALGEDMKTRLHSHGICADKIRVVENWADGDQITPLPFPDGPLIVQYSGNFGLAHETATITRLIERLQNHEDIKFVFVGGGSRLPPLMKLCETQGIHNVEFKEYRHHSELGKSLSESHLGLVTQLPETVGCVVPSKIYGIMAAGRPLLFIGPNHSTPAEHIRHCECGWHIQPGDVDGLEQLLLDLNRNRNAITEAGVKARNKFDRSFHRAIGVAQIMGILGSEPSVNDITSGFGESVLGD